MPTEITAMDQVLLAVMLLCATAAANGCTVTLHALGQARDAAGDPLGEAGVVEVLDGLYAGGLVVTQPCHRDSGPHEVLVPLMCGQAPLAPSQPGVEERAERPVMRCPAEIRRIGDLVIPVGLGEQLVMALTAVGIAMRKTASAPTSVGEQRWLLQARAELVTRWAGHPLYGTPRVREAAARYRRLARQATRMNQTSQPSQEVDQAAS